MSYSFNSSNSETEKLLVKQTIEEYKEFFEEEGPVSYGNCFRLIKQHRNHNYDRVIQASKKLEKIHNIFLYK